MICRALIASAALASLPLPAGAILIRPDRDDAEYLELATRYPASIALPAGGEGVLIAPRWVLTAAHRAKALQEMKPAPKRRGFLSSLDPPSRTVTFRLARLNTDEFQTVSLADYAGVTSFGKVREKRGK